MIGAARAGELTSVGAWMLEQRRLLALDPAAPMAIKRNRHRFVIDAPAASFAESLAEVLTDPQNHWDILRIKRHPDRVGRPFHLGERFCGSISVAQLIAISFDGRPRGLLAGLLASLSTLAPVRALEDLLMSDFAQILELKQGPADGAMQVTYGYLGGSPIGGRSSYSVTPLTSSTCEMHALFEFQEVGLFALFLLHRFGIRAHDRVVLAQVKQAAQRLRTEILQHTLEPLL